MRSAVSNDIAITFLVVRPDNYAFFIIRVSICTNVVSLSYSIDDESLNQILKVHSGE